MWRGTGVVIWNQEKLALYKNAADYAKEHNLALGQGLSERLAAARPFHRLVQAHLRKRTGHHGKRESLRVEVQHEGFKAVILRSDKISRRDSAVRKTKCRRI